MRGLAADALSVSMLAAILTAAIAAPVLLDPSARIFGMDIVGRHHDPFTVMEQFARPLSASLYTQPVSDLAGRALAWVSGPVAAYNWLVLLSFPLAAAAAYLLARYLALSPTGAAFAAIAYAFAPFHLAHAAYHPQIAQTQWMPFYLLALWRCMDEATPAAAGLLIAATIGVTLSNFYGGLIAAVITPVAVAAHWLVIRRSHPHSWRDAAVTVGTLALVAAGGVAYVWGTAHAVIVNRALFAFPRADLFRYSAKWWSYLVPPVEHPLLGGLARRIWDAAGVREGLLEQQVSLGWGVVALGIAAIVRWAGRARRPDSLARVPVLVAVALAALLCSLSPSRTIDGVTFVRPSALLYNLVPMFRSYARFGVAVQLMAALLAGIGVDALRRSSRSLAHVACIALVILAAAEYTVSPFTLWRDVLPTGAHRWVMQQDGRLHVLDCTPPTDESSSVPWLTHFHVTILDDVNSDCIEPNLPTKLAAEGYTDLLVRGDNREGRAFFDFPPPPGLRFVRRFKNAQIFAVTAAAPRIYTAAMMGFSPREYDAERTWRWMGPDAAWAVVNTGTRPVVTTLSVELSAFRQARRMEVAFDGRAMQTLVVEPLRRVYQAGPFTVSPGRHQLSFHPVEAPTIANDVLGNGDTRPLSYAFGTWNWTILRSEQP